MSIKINLGENCKLNHLQHNVSIICFLSFESPPEQNDRGHMLQITKGDERKKKLN
jgi:hypothetical protein